MDKETNLYSEIKKKKKISPDGGRRSKGENNDLSIPPSTLKMIENAGDPDIPIKTTNIPKLQIYAKLSDYNLKNEKIEILPEKSDIDFGFNFTSNSGVVINSNCAFNHVFKPEDTIKKIAPTILAPLYQLLFNGFNGSIIYMGSLGNDKTQFLYQNTIQSNYGFFFHTLQWAFSLLSTYLTSNSLSSTDAYIKISALHFSQRNNTITDLMSIFTENFEPKKNSEYSSTSYYDNISDIYENDDDIDRVCKEMKKTETLKEIHIPTLEDGIYYFKKIMEFQHLGDDETQRTEHTFYFINLYRKQKPSKMKEKEIKENDESSIIKSTLTLIDMGLGERKSKGDPTIITMPAISNIFQLIFQGHKHLLTRNSLFISLFYQYLITSKNKTTVLLTNFSPGDRLNDQANLFHLFCKLFKITNGSKKNSNNKIKNTSLNEINCKNIIYNDITLKKNENLSEYSGAETVIYLGDENISKSSLIDGSDNDKTIKGSHSDNSKISMKNKIISSKKAIQIDFPPTMEKQMLAGFGNINFINEIKNLDDIQVKKNNSIKNLKDNVIEAVFGEEYISKEREYMIWKWMKDNQDNINEENVIFQNVYADNDKKQQCKKNDTSRTDSGIQCDDNEIDHEQMKLWITGRHLDDITEVDEDISCKSNLLSKKPKTYIEIRQSMPREALAEKTIIKDEGCSVEQILSPLRIIKDTKLKNEIDLLQLSFDDISLNENDNSDNDFECESIPDDDLEKAMEASLSLSSIKSHEILCRINKNNRNSLINNPIPEEKCNDIITNYSTQPSESITPSDTAIYRKASYLEMYAEEKLNKILDREDAENKKKKQNIIGKKIKNVLHENILKCCDKNGTISEDTSTISKNDDIFVYDSTSIDNSYSKKSHQIMGNNDNCTDSMYPINGSMNKCWKISTSPNSLKCCFSPMINSETSITSEEFNKQPPSETQNDISIEKILIKESKIPTISEEDRNQIKEQLVNFNKKQKPLTNFIHSRQHTSLPITPLKKLSLQSPLKRIEEAEKKIKSQGGDTIPTSSSTFLNTFISKDNINNYNNSSRNNRSNSLDIGEGFRNEIFIKTGKKNFSKEKDNIIQDINYSNSCNNTIRRSSKNNLTSNNINRKNSNLPILLNSKLPPSPYSKITNAKMVDYNNGTVSSSGHGSDDAKTSTTFKCSLNGLSPGNDSSPISSKTLNHCIGVNKGKNRESFSASSGYESADYQNIHYNLKNLNIKPLKRTSTFNNIYIDSNSNETIKMIKDEQEILKKELKEAQKRIKIFGSCEDEEMSLSDEKVFEDVDKDTIIQTLLTENKVLRKRILAARNHVMMITSFL